MASATAITNDAITYFFLSLATFCSFLNVLVTMLNCNQLLSNTYCRLIFAIQFFNLLAGAVGYPIEGGTVCKVSGALFYFFFLMSNLFTEMLMLLILADLANKRSRYKKISFYLSIIIVVFSGLIAFLPTKYYQPCFVGTYQLYCGYCFKYPQQDLSIMLYYIVPNLLGIILSVLLLQSTRKLHAHLKDYSNLTQRQRQAINIILLPYLTVLLIIINVISQVVFYAFSDFDFTDREALQVFVVWINSVLFLIPLVNLVLFLRFVRKLEEERVLRVRRWRWMFGLRKGRGVAEDAVGLVVEMNKV